MQKLIEKTDLKNIAILTLVNLIIGIYLISTMVLISKDGTLYINSAKQFAIQNLIEATRNIEVCPAYPFLIYSAHKTAGLFTHNESLQRWIISAQAVSLLSKLIASIMLYFIGSFFVGRKKAFWGVLILSLLPDAAEYGSDALSEWPHIMFLTIGFLLLLWGSKYRKSWMFGLVGIVAGLGYLVRTEGCQLVLYGGAWLVYNLLKPQEKMKRIRAIDALILLVAGFAVIAAPYMKLKGYVFPDQTLLKLPAILSINNNSMCTSVIYTSGLQLSKTTGNKTITKNICETLVFYFVPGLLVGCWYYFRRTSKSPEQAFYSMAFIALNIIILLWQSSWLNYLSRRHTLTLIVFTIFYIPIGLEIMAGWICAKTSKGNSIRENKKQRCFYVLLFIGIAICLPKLFKLTSTQKYGYRETASWLSKNTFPTDIIATPDKRITFYAQRQGVEYSENTEITTDADFIVKIIKNSDEKFESDKYKEKYETWVDKKKAKRIIVIRLY
jgi:4-amino-4-deoxy-L-arabinose transferase-like glycosyltransferase